MIRRTLLSVLFCAALLFGQNGNVYLNSFNDEQMILKGDYYSGKQYYPSVAADSLLNSASCYILYEDPLQVYLGLYDFNGEYINQAVFDINPDLLQIRPYVSVAPDGDGLLFIVERSEDKTEVKVYKFNMNGEIDSSPVLLDIDINHSVEMAFDFDLNKRLGVSWITAGDDPGGYTLVNQLFNYELNPLGQPEYITQDINIIDVNRIKHQFRDDGSSMTFVLYGGYYDGYSPLNYTHVEWVDLDSEGHTTTDYNTLNFDQAELGCDITVGEAGVFYTTEFTYWDFLLERQYLKFNKFDLLGQTIDSTWIVYVDARFPGIFYKGGYLYLTFSLEVELHWPEYQNRVIILNEELEIVKRYITPSSNNHNPGNLGVIANNNYEYLVYWSTAEYKNPNMYCQLRLRTVEEGDQFISPVFRPDPHQKRMDTFVWGTVNYGEGNHGILWNSSDIFQRDNYLSLRQSPYPHFNSGRYVGNFYGFSPDEIKFAANKNNSRLFFIWPDFAVVRYRAENLESGSTFSHSSGTDGFIGNVEEVNVIDNGDENFYALCAVKSIMTDFTNIFAAEFSGDGEQLTEFVNIESNLQNTNHTSSNIQVCHNGEDDWVFWLYQDSTGNSSIKGRKFQQPFVSQDSILYTLDLQSEKIPVPIHVSSNESGEIYLFLKLVDHINDDFGELQVIEAFPNADNKIYYSTLEHTAYKISGFESFSQIESNTWLMSYKKENEEDIYLRVFDTFNGTGPEYRMDDFSELNIIDDIFINYINDELLLVYEAELVEDGVASQALYQQRLSPTNPVVAMDGTSGNPEKFQLRGNYPNPFNPSTSIEFTIPESGNVKFEVFNTLGQRVSPVIQQFYMQGKNIIKYSAENLNSGVYIYRVTFGGKNYTNKMIILK